MSSSSAKRKTVGYTAGLLDVMDQCVRVVSTSTDLGAALLTEVSDLAGHPDQTEGLMFNQRFSAWVIVHGCDEKLQSAWGLNPVASQLFNTDVYGPVLFFQINPKTGHTVQFCATRFAKDTDELVNKSQLRRNDHHAGALLVTHAANE